MSRTENVELTVLCLIEDGDKILLQNRVSKESKPIIIDQPEDNLDNQSVYSKLVPCICRARTI